MLITREDSLELMNLKLRAYNIRTYLAQDLTPAQRLKIADALRDLWRDWDAYEMRQAQVV